MSDQPWLNYQEPTNATPWAKYQTSGPAIPSDNPSNLPDGGMGILRRLVAPRPNTTYGDILPVSRENDTGKVHFPVVPNAIRGLVQGAADLLEGPKTGKLTPAAIGTVATLASGGDLKATGDFPMLEAGAMVPAAEEAPQTSQGMLGEQGVRLTPGQRVGGLAKSMEDKATSIPITGDAITAARKRGLSDFNIATINKALEPIGVKLPDGIEAGHPAIEAGQTALSDAYDDLLPSLRFKADEPFAQSVSELHSLTSELPESEAAQFTNILNNRVVKRLGPEGTADGITLKQIESELTRKAGQLKASKQYDLSDAVNQLRANIRDALERQNPEAASDLSNINQAYAMFSRAEDASMRRVTSGGNFTPSDLLQAIKTNAIRTGNRKAYARGDQFLQDWANAGQEVLPSAIPDSGTTGRALLAGAGLGGGGALLGHPVAGAGTIAGLLAGAAPYTRPGIAATNAVMDAAPAVGRTMGSLAKEAAKGTARSSVLFHTGNPVAPTFESVFGQGSFPGSAEDQRRKAIADALSGRFY